MLRSSLLAILALGLAGAAAAGHVVYRCVDRHGTTYSDRPCGARGDPAMARVDLDDPRVPESSSPAHAAEGMGTREVLSRFGRPYETRVIWRNRTLHEVWTWRRDRQAFSVTFLDGRVVAP